MEHFPKKKKKWGKKVSIPHAPCLCVLCVSVSYYSVFLFWSLIRVCGADTSSPQTLNYDVSKYAWDSRYFEVTELTHTWILTSLCHKKGIKDLLHLLSSLNCNSIQYSCIKTGRLWSIVSGYNWDDTIFQTQLIISWHCDMQISFLTPCTRNHTTRCTLITSCRSTIWPHAY